MRKRVSCCPAVTRSGDLRPRRVVQDREAVREAGGDVDVDDADLARRLGVAVGRRHRGRLLEPQHVLEAGIGQRVEKRQLGGAGIAEEIADPGGSQDLHEHGGDVHAPSILLYEGRLGRPSSAGPRSRRGGTEAQVLLVDGGADSRERLALVFMPHHVPRDVQAHRSGRRVAREGDEPVRSAFT